MQIDKVEYGEADGYPALLLTIDGREALITIDLKRTILEQYNAVFLGGNWEGVTAVAIPADPANSQAAMTLDGFTDDPAIVAEVRKWLAWVEGAQ